MVRELSTLQIIARVRGVFARHWIDLGLIIVVFSRGTIRLQGRLQKLQEAGDPVDEGLLNVMDQEIRRVPNVKRVNFNFENWVKTSAGWQRLTDRKAVVRGGGGAHIEAHEAEEEEEELREEEPAEEES
ncbi:hypothetical protein ACFL01_03170 [Planctomycetota bacterium]